MNIFALHAEPSIAASYHCDQHLGKMILESAQMLSTAIHLLASTKWTEKFAPTLYKTTHQNHPCTLWVTESYANFLWVVDLAYCLQSYLPKIHKSTQIIRDCEAIVKLCDIQFLFPSEGLTPFALAMPAHIAHNNATYPTAVDKYQAYYQEKATQWAAEGKKEMTYRFRAIPPFMRSILA